MRSTFLLFIFWDKLYLSLNYIHKCTELIEQRSELWQTYTCVTVTQIQMTW